jgi:16S rRNA (uracil1498-N3)-methyltransferase
MRASYDPELVIQENYVISGDRFHHLAHVVRLDARDHLLLLNGKGLCVVTVVKLITKKEIHLDFLSQELAEQTLKYDVLIGIPKKDALDLCLKQATELGFRKILLVRTHYSQNRVPEIERMDNLLVSALEQSNSPYMPEVLSVELNEVEWDQYEHILLLDSQTKERQNNDRVSSRKSLLVLGPEGGFSESELTYLHALKQVEVQRLSTPILRTPTALATGAGILLGRLLD